MQQRYICVSLPIEEHLHHPCHTCWWHATCLEPKLQTCQDETCPWTTLQGQGFRGSKIPPWHWSHTWQKVRFHQTFTAGIHQPTAQAVQPMGCKAGYHTSIIWCPSHTLPGGSAADIRVEPCNCRVVSSYLRGHLMARFTFLEQSKSYKKVILRQVGNKRL